MSSRESIPAKLRRRVLVEAGHRCAIPTCRHIDVDVHHIIPWEKVGKHEYNNLIALCPNCHRRAHKGDIDRKSLRIYKSNLRFTHDKFSQLEVDVLFELYKQKDIRDVTSPGGQRSAGGILFPYYQRILITRIDEAGYITWRHPSPNSAKILVGGINTMPSLIQISEKGIEFIESLNLEHEQ